jgi:hypothetical protein
MSRYCLTDDALVWFGLFVQRGFGIVIRRVSSRPSSAQGYVTVRRDTATTTPKYNSYFLRTATEEALIETQYSGFQLGHVLLHPEAIICIF